MLLETDTFLLRSTTRVKLKSGTSHTREEQEAAQVRQFPRHAGHNLHGLSLTGDVQNILRTLARRQPNKPGEQIQDTVIVTTHEKAICRSSRPY